MPTFSSPRMVASVLQEGPRVQMIFARRKGAVSGVQRDGVPDEFSVMIESRNIVNGRRSSVVGRRSSVVGRRSSVVGRRSSVVGRRSSERIDGQFGFNMGNTEQIRNDFGSASLSTSVALFSWATLHTRICVFGNVQSNSRCPSIVLQKYFLSMRPTVSRSRCDVPPFQSQAISRKVKEGIRIENFGNSSSTREGRCSNLRLSF